MVMTISQPAGRTATDAGVSPVDDHRSGGEFVQVGCVTHTVVVGRLEEASIVSCRI